jgi:hypothetical protein
MSETGKYDELKRAIVEHLRREGGCTRLQIITALDVDDRLASNLLQEMRRTGALVCMFAGRWSIWSLPSAKTQSAYTNDGIHALSAWMHAAASTSREVAHN